MQMALVRRKGKLYYYRSKRVGSRVTSEYVANNRYGAASDIALLNRFEREEARHERLCAELERREEQERIREARDRLQQNDDRLKVAEFMVGCYWDNVEQVMGTVLKALGYHRHHRGEWRRKRGMASKELARVDIHELMRLAREGDREARGELARSAAELHLYEMAELGEGYIEHDVEQILLRQLPDGHGALHREAVAARLALMREELAPPGSSPIERILAERATVSWLWSQVIEMELYSVDISADTCSEHVHMMRWLDAQDRRLTRAQRRMTSALSALVRVRKLNIPIVIGQVNVAERQLNLANVAPKPRVEPEPGRRKR
jgi:hypothetical protein